MFVFFIKKRFFFHTGEGKKMKREKRVLDGARSHYHHTMKIPSNTINFLKRSTEKEYLEAKQITQFFLCQNNDFCEYLIPMGVAILGQRIADYYHFTTTFVCQYLYPEVFGGELFLDIKDIQELNISFLHWILHAVCTYIARSCLRDDIRLESWNLWVWYRKTCIENDHDPFAANAPEIEWDAIKHLEFLIQFVGNVTVISEEVGIFMKMANKLVFILNLPELKNKRGQLRDSWSKKFSLAMSQMIIGSSQRK